MLFSSLNMFYMFLTMPSMKKNFSLLNSFLCFSRASAHPPLFAFHAMHLMCLMLHQLPFIFSPPLGHPSIPIFHILCISCGYLHKHHYSTTAPASKPLNLSVLHVPLSFFQLSVSIATFNFLPSVMFH